MKVLFYLLVIFYGFINSQNKHIKVELVDYSADQIPAHCGYQTEWGILKFRVIKNNDLFNENQIISGFFMCPRERLEETIGIENLISGSEYEIEIGDPVPDKEIPEKTTIISKVKHKPDLTFALIKIKPVD